ncbi:hypothetical protein ACFY7Y_37955 [Streptomyces virginiae]
MEHADGVCGAGQQIQVVEAEVFGEPVDVFERPVLTARLFA